MSILRLPAVCAMCLAMLVLSCASPKYVTPNDESSKSTSDEPYAIEPDIDNEEYASLDGDIELEKLSQAFDGPADTSGNINDVSVAIDDYIWRQLNSAYEFYSMGVLANQESAWEEAQYYFEKSLSILGDLDLEVEGDSLTAEAAQYNRLLAEITVSYRYTLLSLGHLPGDVSIDALMSRFSEINSIKVDSAEFKKLEDYAQDKISYNVPIIMNERVKKCILYYQTAARDVFAKHLSRSTKYLPMFRRIFEEYGLPTDLVYLASVESGYSPHAYSWARAMGLWQFIASTGRLYDLDRSWWYDERKDPIKATHAAASFLKDLYEQFGSWELALAAYNGGPGRVRGTIRKQKTTDFWKMKLRKQTMDYVPFFMAATIISKNPEKFGFENIQYQDEWEYDEVTIDKCLDLNVIAKALGMTVKDIKEHNPELLRNFTPPNIKKYTLRLPKGTKHRFMAAYNDMPSSKETSFVRHVIKRGETVSTIARKYGVSQYAIFETNNLSRRSKIYAGKTLVIPVPNDRSYSQSKNSSYEAEGNVYIVRSGDTVWDIARAFKTTPEKIRRLNNLDRRARIYVGQRLKLWESGSSSTKTVASTKKSTPSPSTAASGGQYTVRQGDNLWDIAVKFGTTVSALRNANGLGRNSRIYPKQKLNIPEPSSSRRSGGGTTIYTVRRGDTLWDIANAFNTSVAKLLAWNDLSDPGRISIGDKLTIYSD